MKKQHSKFRESPDDAWPLLGADGKPFHERTPPVREKVVVHFIEDYEPQKDVLHGMWIVPLFIFIFSFLWMAVPN